MKKDVNGVWAKICSSICMKIFVTTVIVVSSINVTFAQPRLQRIAQGFTAPLLALEMPSAPKTLLVVEQGGLVRIVKRG
jgi:hypothetical protein